MTDQTEQFSTEPTISSIPSPDGRWNYPSEKSFSAALERKQKSAKETKSLVPIHNAINEQTWALVTKWEADSSCSPVLLSFKGDASRVSPKSFLYRLCGYKAPFDRHDWIVGRCEEKIHYVIDYYKGEGDSVFIDCRPEITERIKMALKGLFK